MISSNLSEQLIHCITNYIIASYIAHNFTWNHKYIIQYIITILLLLLPQPTPFFLPLLNACLIEHLNTKVNLKYRPVYSIFLSYRAVNSFCLGYKTVILMLHTGIIGFHSEMRKTHVGILQAECNFFFLLSLNFLIHKFHKVNSFHDSQVPYLTMF